MTTLPILEIIFAIILSALPNRTKEFTLTSPMMNSEPLVCKLQDDGTWKGSSKKGQIVFEGWKISETKIVKESTANKKQEDVDLSDWITLKGKTLLVEGKPIKIEKTKDNALFFTTSSRYLGIFRVETKTISNKIE